MFLISKRMAGVSSNYSLDLIFKCRRCIGPSQELSGVVQADWLECTDPRTMLLLPNGAVQRFSG